MTSKIWMEKIGDQVLHHLPDTIQTFSNQNRKTVSFLMQRVKADKSQISSLINNIRALDIQANYSPALALRYSPLNVEGVIEFFRDSSLRLSQFFSASSSMSNIVNSMISIFSSEIEKIEKDVKYLENFIDNYQFISGEDDLFNFNYIENFDNDLQSTNAEAQNITLFDRDGVNFSDNGDYYIDPVLSRITISSGKTFINTLKNYSIEEYETNYSQEEFTTTNTGIDLSLNENPIDSWNVTIKSPYILTSQIPKLSSYVSYDISSIRGAQSKFTISFNAPHESNFVRINPSTTNGFQILQVIVEGTSYETSVSTSSTAGEYIKVPVLSAPLLLNGPSDILFPKMFVSKITFIFNQSKYLRNENLPITQETNSKLLQQIVDSVRKKREETPSKIQDLVYYYFKRANNPQFARINSKNFTEVYSSRYPSIEKKPTSKVSTSVLEYSDSEIVSKALEIIEEKNSNAISNIVQSIVQHAIDSRSNIFASNVYRSNSSNFFENRMAAINTDGIIPTKNESQGMSLYFQKEDPQAPSVSSLDVTKYLNTKETTNAYEYYFGIKNILLGNTIDTDAKKACFISKKIETNGTPLAVKAIVNKVSERKNLNYFNYDLKEPGSYELSFTMKENIVSELDWIPLALSSTSNVDSEVLFFDPFSKASLRFYAIAETVTVYKDGKLDSINNWIYSKISNEIIYLGQIESKSRYVVQYQMDRDTYDASIINLDSISDSALLIQSFTDGSNPGEYFTSTTYGNKISLQKTPFIEDRFNGAYYSDTYGTVAVDENSGYSPILIVFEDGTTSTNMTNYTKNSFTRAPFYQTPNYLFYQNGKDIIFNRPVEKSFRVLYKYIPSNLRFRLIMRDNIFSQNANISVDNVIIKCKVKNLDPLSEKLLRLK